MARGSGEESRAESASYWDMIAGDGVDDDDVDLTGGAMVVVEP